VQRAAVFEQDLARYRHLLAPAGDNRPAAGRIRRRSQDRLQTFDGGC
jgi:hypothetical protein